MFSRSSFPPIAGFLPRARPTASISSIKTIQGAFSLACLNRSRTREAPTPTNISTKSEPDREKNGTSASPATALANNVFPVPGGPTSKAPLGILPPNSVYFSGLFKKETISSTSCFASARPATSLNVTFRSLSLSKSCAFAFPTLNTPPGPPVAPPDIRRIRKIHTTMISKIGPNETRKFQIASSPSSKLTCVVI